MLDTSNAVLVQPDGWARGEREGYGGPCDVTSLSLTYTQYSTTPPRRASERVRDTKKKYTKPHHLRSKNTIKITADASASLSKK